jgi:hypothetical protein
MTNEERKELETVKRFHEISTRCAFTLYDSMSEDDICFLLSQLKERDNRIAELQAQLITIRADTIEECAKVCDALYESAGVYTYRAYRGLAELLRDRSRKLCPVNNTP